MRLLAILLAVALGPLACPASEYTEAILREMNLARTLPQVYAKIIAENAHPGREGDKAIREAVRALEKLAPLPPLTLCEGLTRAAADHVSDTGRTAAMGHTGSDGSRTWTRVSRYGTWIDTVGENIHYGKSSARMVVVRLLVDDGVKGRGHRDNLLKRDFRVVGIAAGSHATAGSMCVTDFAGGFVAKDSVAAR